MSDIRVGILTWPKTLAAQETGAFPQQISVTEAFNAHIGADVYNLISIV